MNNLKHVTTVVCAATVLLLCGLGLPALAKDNCQADAQKLCPGTTPGNPDYADCLKQHSEQLSKACQHQLGAAQARANDIKQYPACMADAGRLCPRTKPGGGRIIVCLRTHQSDLSSECKQELRDHGKLH